MKFVADVDLRRLVESSLLLDSQYEKSEHPLGLGIPRRKTYPHFGGALSLPASESGLSNLRSVTSGRVHDLAADRSQIAWGHLLGRPTLTVPLATPTEQELDVAGVALAADVRAALVRVGVVAVVHLPGEALIQGILRGTRLAGVGTLTLRPHASGRYFDDAWLEATWTTSTTGLVAAIESLIPVMAGASTHKIDQRPVMVVLAPTWVNRLSTAEVAELEAAAHVFGFRVSVSNGTAKNFGSIQTVMTQNLPRHLIIVGQEDATTRGIASAFVAKGGPGQIVGVDDKAGRNILPALREVFASLAGVSAGLLPLPSPDEEPETTVSNSWSNLDVTFAECLHDGSERQYRLDIESGLWWTRDTAGHGGSVFKTYRRVDERLLHVADHDANGCALPNKFKGEKGMTISVADLHGCSSEHISKS